MAPRAKLQGMPVSKRVSGNRVSLGTDLDLLFQAELGRKRELCREILDEAGDRIQGLSVERMHGREEESDRRNKDLTYVSAVPLVHRTRPPNDTCPVGTTAARAARPTVNSDATMLEVGLLCSHVRQPDDVPITNRPSDQSTFYSRLPLPVRLILSPARGFWPIVASL